MLAGLTDNNRNVLIPGFCTYLSVLSFTPTHTDRATPPLRTDDKVRPQDDEEAALFRLLESVTQRSAASLKSRWREPSLTIHGVRGSGPHNPTVIPASVTAQVSLRIVPDQVLDTVCAELIQHLRASFDALNSANTIKVNEIPRGEALSRLLLVVPVFLTLPSRSLWTTRPIGGSEI